MGILSFYRFCVGLGSATAAVTVKIVATAAVAARGRIAATVAAARDEKEHDDEKPDHVVVIENIAETIHKYPPFAVVRRFHQK
jgi:hypothetical protein